MLKKEESKSRVRSCNNLSVNKEYFRKMHIIYFKEQLERLTAGKSKEPFNNWLARKLEEIFK